MIRLWYCDSSLGTVTRFENFADATNVPTHLEPKPANQFVGATKATLTVPGATINGDVVYQARHGGSAGNMLLVEHVLGNTGPSFLDRALAVTRSGMDITVTFGTDFAGDSVSPQAQALVDLINGDSDIIDYASASVGGTGLDTSSLYALTGLNGGIDDRDWRKFLDTFGSCRRINTVETI